MRFALFVLCSVFACNTAIAQTKPTQFGNFDCGKWVNAPDLISKAWLAGYVSGINYATATNTTDPLGKVSSIDQIFLWMDNYCRSNPLKSVQNGAAALYSELEKR